MHRPVFLFLLSAAVVSLTGCDFAEWGDGQRFQEDFHQSHPLKAGGRLYVETINGSIEVSGWDQETADISGTKYASTEQAKNALRVDIVATGDSVRIRTVRPSGHRGNMGAKYVIRVPKRTAIERVETSNGAIKIDGIEGDARARTSNGGIDVVLLKGSLDAATSNGAINADQVEGSVDLKTSNGAIDVTMTSFKPESRVEMATSNGGITLKIPATAAARLKATTSNASVSCDLDVKVTAGEVGKNHLEGAIGAGGPLITLSTSNGPIHVQKL